MCCKNYSSAFEISLKTEKERERETTCADFTCINQKSR